MLSEKMTEDYIKNLPETAKTNKDLLDKTKLFKQKQLEQTLSNIKENIPERFLELEKEYFPKGMDIKLPETFKAPSAMQRFAKNLFKPINTILKPLISNPLVRGVSSSMGAIGSAANAKFAYDDFKAGDKFGGGLRSVGFYI
jgi:hypothetical protein